MPGVLRAPLTNPYGPQVTFRTEDVLPPSAFYLSMDDTLIGHFITSASGLTFTLTVRMLLADGELKVETYDTTPTPFNPNNYDVIVPPVEGYVLSCMVQLNGTIDGSAWGIVAVFSGTATQPIVVFPPVTGMVLVQGYLDEWTWLSWPNSPLVEAGVGAGRIRRIAPGLSPGTNWTVQTSSTQRWEILTVDSLLTTSAAAGNRQMSLVLFDRLGNALCRFPTNFTQAASLGYSYYFYNNATHIQTNTTWITAPFPTGIYLDPGMSVRSAVLNLDAGDQWSNVNVVVREWMGVGHS
jgi:hypothetical protein